MNQKLIIGKVITLKYITSMKNSNFIFIDTRFEVYRKCIIYSKKYTSCYNVVFNYEIYDNGFHNDLDGGIPSCPK